MHTDDKRRLSIAIAVFGALSLGIVPTPESLAQSGDTPLDLRTPAPVIHLADNLDEADGLGWCIDTVGRGFNTDLHAHSCKPQGGDVQFAYDAEVGAIRSVAFPDYCVTTDGGGGTDLGLTGCNPDDSTQQFAYDPDAGTLSPVGTPEHCISVGTTSRSAGPFMSRDLLLADCASTPPYLIHWVVLD